MTPNWRPLAACLLCGFVAGWMAQGWRKDVAIADLRQAAASQAASTAAALAQATTRVLELERAAGTALAQRADQLKQEQTHAKTERDNFNADVRSGAVRMSIPVAGSCAPAAPAADTAAAAGNRHEARAELDPAAAAALGAIAGDGDDATRQLNACIDAYHSVMEKFNVQAQ